MATTQPILRLGKSDEGRLVSSDEFAEAEFDEPWKYEREDGRLIVLPPNDEDQVDAIEPWRDELAVFKLANPGVVQRVASNAWNRVNDSTDRIGDIGVYLMRGGPVPKIPDRVPELLFGVVRPDKSSRDRDYIRKRAEYHALGVQEYVIIDRFQKIVTVLTIAPNGYDERILTIGETYESPLLPGFSIRLSEVF